MTVDQINRRDFSYCVATYYVAGGIRWEYFLVGTPSKPTAREQALAYAEEHWGTPDDLSVYPRRYVREARALLAAGGHRTAQVSI